MRTIAASVVGVCVVGALIGRGVAASPGQAQDSVLAALLVEVRGLRAAMEQMASAGPRVQLALGRLQLQEQRLNTMIRRLESTHDALAAAQRDVTQRQDQVTAITDSLKTGASPDRAEAEDMLNHLKRDVALKSADVQRLSAEAASIANDIAAEQGRWNEINHRLEELERTLGRR